MKIKLRWIAYFLTGVLVWVLGMGIAVGLIIELIFPLFQIAEDSPGYDSLVLITLGCSVLVCGVLFSWYFGGPLTVLLSWIFRLSQGSYEPPPWMDGIYTRAGKLRWRYSLYKEVIAHLLALAETLKRSEMERKQLEEAKRSWLAGISHDLKTPLTYVLGYSALLINEDYVWSEQEIRSFAREIHNKSVHMEELIHDLSLSFQMDHARSALPMNREVINVGLLLEELVSDVRRDPRAAGYELNVRKEEDVPGVFGDRRLLYRAFQNLIMNAVIHNPPGTRIGIEIWREGSRRVRITVTDHGTGMDKHTLENLFNQYYRGTATNATPFGTGLGMAIVKSLIMAHDGEIDVQSEPFEGTCFTITLPLAEAAG
ncbi:ATP-binding protein [Paenibacillus chartarius]|uniref:histidine kinase n=1 Tax=Paenibacillus chartarius TaxID=747481 RepID=A0ABV6DLL9_9BACL